MPAGDAQRIDLWYVPSPELLEAHPEIEPGLLRFMAAEPGMVEIWSAAPDTADFHECTRKHRQWHHTLELRAGRKIPLPSAWLVCAGRPDTLLRDFGFVLDVAAVASGVYRTEAPGWQVRIVVIPELPRVRSTVLLRLLGSARVRRMALQDLAALPEDAWERRLAFPWLVRLSFEVPAVLAATLPAEERDFIMETQEWFERFTAQKVEEGVQEALQKALQKALPKAVQEALPKAVQKALPKAVQEAKESWQLETMARLCRRRLGRPLTETENAALANRIEQLGEDPVEEVVLSSSSDALGAWLAEPNAM
ncbi:MAG TPA: hypothetical protein VE093_03100 [Polyangiaceae bacterium]|nr:hypothetical protein [Polyangiaceae bacterium]